MCIRVLHQTLNILSFLRDRLASLLLFTVLLSAYFAFQPERLTGAYLFIFCAWSGLAFLYNIVPGSRAIDMSQGDLTYNDGTETKDVVAQEEDVS